ncbi:MAG: hypothetical protein AMXMBFR84_29390 [Candidatus Hydrogenedentota bacterium]
MTTKYTLAQIKQFWEQQALEHGESPVASWSDTPVMDLEIREIISRIKDGDKVLDVGCANGFSTVQFAASRSVDILGLDYIPQMIDAAKERLKRMDGNLLGNVRFDVGDITSLQCESSQFDVAIAIRVLINLETWDNQVKGIRECARVVKPGGIVMFSEATLQGWNKMNAFRAEWGLPAIPMPQFNHYLDEEAVKTACPDLEFVDVVNFASTYFIGTRVLKPLLAQFLGDTSNVANPNMEWNRFFSMLPAYGDYGTQKLFVFKKK